MHEIETDERVRLAREMTHRGDDERRGAVHTLQLLVACVGFALAPLVPGARAVFGELSALQAATFVAPALGAALLSRSLRRVRGPESRAVQVTTAMIPLFFYGCILAYIVGSGSARSPLWVLAPFTAFLWATTTPFDVRYYMLLLLGAHAAQCVAFLVTGASTDVLVSIAAGVGSASVYLAVSVRGRRRAIVKADLHLASAQLSAMLLERERHRIARDLAAKVGHEVVSMIDEVERRRDGSPRWEPIAERARVALAELEAIVWPSRSDAHSLASLRDQLDERCRSLCPGIEYASSVREEGAPSPIGADEFRALVRMGQELVRNAVTHARPRFVFVELSNEGGVTLCVRDDGAGIPAGALHAATGGLSAARAWLHERGGTLEVVEPPRPPARTELRAVLPA